MAKIAGLYRDDREDRGKRPFNITHVAVILDHGDETVEETRRVTKLTVSDGESRA